MYLLDTNIFLSVLLQEATAKDCEKVIMEQSGNIAFSDFTLHTIGVKLLSKRNYVPDAFVYFSEKMFSIGEMETISGRRDFEELVSISKKHNMDFDDAYQAVICKNKNLTIITQDHDFKRIEKEISVLFLDDY